MSSLAGCRARLEPFGGEGLRGEEALCRLRLFADGRLLCETRAGDLRLEEDPLEAIRSICEELQLPALGWLGYEFGSAFEEVPAPSLRRIDWPLFDFCWYEDLDRSRADAGKEAAPKGSVDRRTPAPLWPKERWIRSVEHIRQAILRGDVYQVNLVQPFAAELDAPADELYEDLSHAAPPAFSALLESPEGSLLSLSPELFVQRRGNTLAVRPIKGSRPPRPGAEEELIASEKERAELAMIVDLLRNDLSRVCRPGSVTVEAFPELLRLPTIVHSQARITGVLREDRGFPEAIRALFPCGSISGCPRRAAMEHIVRLEGECRGPAMGAIGWLEPGGDFTFSVAIRTAWITEGRLLLYAGGGITIDSDPEEEYAESLQKVLGFASGLYR